MSFSYINNYKVATYFLIPILIFNWNTAIKIYANKRIKLLNTYLIFYAQIITYKYIIDKDINVNNIICINVKR
jgi:hypothetical protein